MPSLPPEIAVDPVHPLPMSKAYADHLGLVSLLHHDVPTAMEVDAGPIGLGLVWDTLRGRSPLYRFEECCAHQDTARLLGKAGPAHALTDETVGRVLARLADCGTLRLLTDWAVRAVMRLALARRSGHVAPTSRRVWGASQCAETQDLPGPGTSGYRTEKRPALQPCVLSTLCVERAVPMWGQPEDGQASAKTLKTTLWSEIPQR